MFTLLPTQHTNRTVKFGWKDLPAGTVSVRVNSISTEGRETGPTVTLPVLGDGIGGGYSPNWRYDFTSFALDAAGKQLGLGSPVIGFQVKEPATPIPTPTPTPTPTMTEHVIEFPPIVVEGQPVKLVRTVQVTATGDRTVKAK